MGEPFKVNIRGRGDHRHAYVNRQWVARVYRKDGMWEAEIVTGFRRRMVRHGNNRPIRFSVLASMRRHLESMGPEGLGVKRG